MNQYLTNSLGEVIVYDAALNSVNFMKILQDKTYKWIFIYNEKCIKYIHEKNLLKYMKFYIILIYLF